MPLVPLLVCLALHAIDQLPLNVNPPLATVATGFIVVASERHGSLIPSVPELTDESKDSVYPFPVESVPLVPAAIYQTALRYAANESPLFIRYPIPGLLTIQPTNHKRISAGFAWTAPAMMISAAMMTNRRPHLFQPRRFLFVLATPSTYSGRPRPRPPHPLGQSPSTSAA
jgi:hypothetical protein